MNVLDIMAFAIIAISVWGAISKGLVVELISLASVILGFVLAGLYYDVLDVFFLGVASPPRTGFFAFTAIFLAVIVIGMITAALLNKVLKKLWLKWLDRLLGAFFGLVRGWLIVSIIFLAFTGGLAKYSPLGRFWIPNSLIFFVSVFLCTPIVCAAFPRFPLVRRRASRINSFSNSATASGQ